jgi:glycerol-3-phosphate dehydrogenase (NAD(P)+)
MQAIDPYATKIGVIGAGAWGTALAIALAEKGHPVLLWAYEPEVYAAMGVTRENRTYLPGVILPAKLRPTDRFDEFADCRAVLLAPPAQHMRATLDKAAPYLTETTPLVICAKGIDNQTGQLMSDIVGERLPLHPLAVLSGPSFAIEVARKLPAALTLACRDQHLGENLVTMMATRSFRLYLSDDMVGAEIGGAIKNVIAIACGIVEGKKFGDNGRAALITRGLAEMTRLGVALGARPETFMGLSGLGDLVLTCSALQSRNMSLGKALGEGQRLQDILASRHSVAEGVYTAAAALQLAVTKNVDMPIVAAVDAILNKGVAVDTAISELLARPMRLERD